MGTFWAGVAVGVVVALVAILAAAWAMLSHAVVARFTTAEPESALITAVLDGDVAAVDRLVRSGADPNVRQIARQADPHGWGAKRGVRVRIPEGSRPSALTLACELGRPEIAVILLNAGAGPSVTNDAGVGPLHAAVRSNDSALVQVLLRAGAEVDRACLDGATPLMLAAGCGEVGIMHELLKAGADVGVRDDEGGTALHHAADGGSVQAVQRLLDADADPGAVDNAGLTPAAWATERGHAAAALLLERARGKAVI